MNRDRSHASPGKGIKAGLGAALIMTGLTYLAWVLVGLVRSALFERMHVEEIFTVLAISLFSTLPLMLVLLVFFGLVLGGFGLLFGYLDRSRSGALGRRWPARGWAGALALFGAVSVATLLPSGVMSTFPGGSILAAAIGAVAGALAGWRGHWLYRRRYVVD